MILVLFLVRDCFFNGCCVLDNVIVVIGFVLIFYGFGFFKLFFICGFFGIRSFSDLVCLFFF